MWMSECVSGKLTKCKVMIMTKHVIAFYVNEVENLLYMHKDFVTHWDNQQQIFVLLWMYEWVNTLLIFLLLFLHLSVFGWMFWIWLVFVVIFIIFSFFVYVANNMQSRAEHNSHIHTNWYRLPCVSILKLH